MAILKGHKMTPGERPNVLSQLLHTLVLTCNWANSSKVLHIFSTIQHATSCIIMPSLELLNMRVTLSHVTRNIPVCPVLKHLRPGSKIELSDQSPCGGSDQGSR